MASGVKYPGASATPFYIARSEICVNNKGECVGNGLFAGDNFDAGTHIFAVRRPLVGSLDPVRLQDTCANCYTWTEGSTIGSRLYVKEGTKVDACTGCRRFKYCSKACQKEAWKRAHKHECKNMKETITKEVPKAVQATMEILIRRKHGLIPDQQWQMLRSLDTHVDDFKRNGNYDGIQLMALGCRNYSMTQDMFSTEFVEGMYARVLTNSLTLVTPTYDPLGIIVDEKLGLINHSCDPNAYIVMDGPEVAVRALKPIKKDEEIFIAYIDTTNPYPRRQSELKARWFFTCRCTKCAKGPTLLEDKWAIEPRNLADKWKERGDVLMRRDFAKDPANYVGESQDEKRVAAIQGQAFDMYETEQRTSEPTEAIRVIEEGMRLCYQSGLWPVYRQPYAAFRDDLIVNMLSVENFEIAWAQCAKRYRYMLPKLYQQKAHPVRVVQVWQTAMLAMYIADKQPMPPGVDLRLISLMLVNEVKDLCSLSHGENNSFSKSVQTMFYEMMTTLREQLGPAAADRMVAQIPEQRRKFLEMGDWTQY